MTPSDVQLSCLKKGWRQYHAEICFIDMRLSAMTIQCAFRRYCQEKRLAIAVQSTVCLQRNVRMWRARQNLQSSINAVVSIQSSWRRYSAQKTYSEERDASICIQKYYRRHVAENAYLDKLTAIIIQQSWWRRYSAQIKYRQYLAERNADQELAATKIQTVYRRIAAQKRYKKLRERAPAYSIKAWIRQINHKGLEDARSPEKSGRRLSHRTSLDGRASETGTPELNTRPLYRPRRSLSPAPPVPSEGERKSASSPQPTEQRPDPSTDASPLPKFRRRPGLNKDRNNGDGSSLRSKLYASRSSVPNPRGKPLVAPGKEKPMPKATATPAAAKKAEEEMPMEPECASLCLLHWNQRLCTPQNGPAKTASDLDPYLYLVMLRIVLLMTRRAQTTGQLEKRSRLSSNPIISSKKYLHLKGPQKKVP